MIKNNPLQSAAKEGNLPVIQYLSNHGYDLDGLYIPNPDDFSAII